jgi:hypothetical protein
MTMAANRSDIPSQRLVRHVFWKYPIIAAGLLVGISVVAAAAGSPNAPRETIASAAARDPGGCVLAFAHELAGAGSSSVNASEFGVGPPGQVFVLRPLRAAIPVLGDVKVGGLPTLHAADVRTAVQTYDAASPAQQRAWAIAYHHALDALAPMGAAGGMEGSEPSPDFMKVGSLRGNFGPVPALVETDLFLARTGYLQQYLESVDPGHSFHLVNIWLYDHPELLATAVDKGLTDDQWGMVKERGFPVGPWFLAIPAVIHIYFPSGTTGTGFVLWNVAFALVLLLAVPLIPGVRDLPRRLKLYRFIYRYPRPGELEQPALRERHGPVHGGPTSGTN